MVAGDHHLHLGQPYIARQRRRGIDARDLVEAESAFSRDAVSPQEAIRLLIANLKHRRHRFWADEIGFAPAVEPIRDRIVGHRQVSDAYLLGLAIHHDGRLATLDRAVPALLPSESPERKRVVVIGG